MPFVPGTGAPDGEARAMPHGDTLETLTGQTATVGGYVSDNGGDGWHVAAYRSFVVVVVNSGTFDILVTPRWAFWNASSSIYTETTQRVPALTHKHLIFQNEADWIKKVTFAGDGGSSLFSYYITGANLDPFSGGPREILSLIRRTPAQSIPDSVGTVVEYGPDPATRFYTNQADDWAFDLTGAGDISGVHLLKQGLYLLRAHFAFAAPGNYNKQLQLLWNSTMPNPPLTVGGTDMSFDTFAAQLDAQVYTGISAAASGIANNTLQVSAFQQSGGPLAVDDSLLQVIRLGSVFP